MLAADLAGSYHYVAQHKNNEKDRSSGAHESQWVTHESMIAKAFQLLWFSCYLPIFCQSKYTTRIRLSCLYFLILSDYICADSLH